NLGYCNARISSAAVAVEMSGWQRPCCHAWRNGASRPCTNTSAESTTFVSNTTRTSQTSHHTAVICALSFGVDVPRLQHQQHPAPGGQARQAWHAQHPHVGYA